MKKIFTSLLLLVSALSAGAQDIYSATSISENNYSGTARSVALGNAMTAVGGDLGSFAINPAGSAVSPFNQLVISPGISVAFNSSRYAPTFDISQRGPSEKDFGPAEKSSYTRFVIPEIGFNFNFETGSSYGLVGFSVGFLSSVTNNYTDYAFASGTNVETSMLGALASDATRDLYNDFWSLNDEVAAGSYMILRGSDVDPRLGESQFFGVTESPDEYGIWSTKGEENPLIQSSSVRSFGVKNDVLFNMGFNISNICYLGFNLGMPRSVYNYQEGFTERATYPDRYDIYRSKDFFKSSTYGYELNRVVTGIYAKFGAIVLPMKNLRVGFAVQTPVSYNVSEAFKVSGNMTTDKYSNNSTASDSWAYRLCAPYRLNAGVAYTFSNRAFASIDYEMSDYSVMKFSQLYDYPADYYYTNNQNRLFRGVQHMLRLGVEYRVTTEFSVRAGYNTTTSPEKYYQYNGEKVTADNYYDFQGVPLGRAYYFSDRTKAFSAGVGYSTHGSLFFDLAARLTQYPATTFLPYSDYIYDSDNILSVPSPSISSSRSLLDIIFTIGCRF